MSRAYLNDIYWHGSSDIKNKSYICGYCGENITSNEGYYTKSRYKNGDALFGYIYICHNCLKPTFFNVDNKQTPGEIIGKNFSGEIFNDELLYELYNEARKCFSINAYTSCGMCCRKILMHIAVNKGAKTDQSFAYYVDYLDEENLIPVNCKDWVNLIRTKGNEANHDIIILSKEDADALLQFIEILIAIIYEMPFRAKAIKTDNVTTSQ